MASKAATLVPKGGFLMGILTEGKTPMDVATTAELNSWIKSTGAQYTYTLDSVAPQPFMEDFFNTGRDTQIIIDLSTMKILKIFTADPEGAVADLDKRLTAAAAMAPTGP